MSKQHCTITELTDKEASDMFKHLCVSAIGSTEAEMKKQMGIKGPVGIVDVIGLIRSANLDVTFKVEYDQLPAKSIPVKDAAKAEKADPDAPKAEDETLPW